MKCKFCGNELEKGVKFCPVCGTEVLSEDSSANGEQPEIQYEDPNKRTEYDFGQSGYSQGNYGQTDDTQFDSIQGNYSYGQFDNTQGNYNYGQSNSGNNQSENGYSQPNYGQSGNGYNQSNYSQSGNGYSQTNYNQSNFGQPAEPIKSTSYLIFSILTTLCCCLPLGIVSIVYASKIDSLQRMGDYEGAKDAAKKAKIFIIVGAIGGFLTSIGVGAFGMLDFMDEFNRELTGSSIMSDVLDDEDDEEDERDDEESASSAPVQVSEDLGDSWKGYTIQVNDTVLKFPCTIEEVEKTGLKMDTETISEDYVINKNDYDMVYFNDEDYHGLMFVVSNNTEEARTVSECTVNGVYVNDYDVEDGYITAVFPGGIQIGEDIEKVIEKWGEPDDVYEGDYSDSYNWYDGASLNSCFVYTEPDTDKVIMIALNGQELE